jgi:hypothetical protein
MPQDWLKAEELLDVETDQFSSPGGTVVVIVGYGPYVGVPDPQMINGPTHGLVEYQAVAWGKMMRLTERALMSTAREAFVVIDRDFYNKGGFAADGSTGMLSKPVRRQHLTGQNRRHAAQPRQCSAGGCHRHQRNPSGPAAPQAVRRLINLLEPAAGLRAAPAIRSVNRCAGSSRC